MEESYENSEPVLLDGCEIREVRQGDGFEVIVKNGTEILKLPKSGDSFEVIVKNGTEILKSLKSFQTTKDKSLVSLEKVKELPEYETYICLS